MSGLNRTVLAPRASALAALVVAVLASGCGPGSKGYRVSGKVTFQGKAVPAGKVYFIPDSSKGNTGPTGYADITDGAYDTAATGGQGFIGGPVIIAVEGLDPGAKGGKVDKGDTSGEVTLKTLFPRYEFATELPKEASTKDIEVPADAAKRPVEKGPAQVVP
jgi:hypothetical protein